MRGWRSVLLGFCTAVLSSTILAGSLILSLVENGYEIAQQPVSTITMTSSPLTTQFIIPGRPTRTAAATIFIPDTPTLTVTPTPTFTPSLTFSPRPPLPPSLLPSPTNPVTFCGPPPGWVEYIVRYGDTLSNLSERLSVSIFQLQMANCMNSYLAIYAGQTIFVPYYPPNNPLLPPPPPATPIFFFTPIYTYEEPPTSTNNYAPMATIQPSPSSTLTSTSASTPTETTTSTNTILAPLPPSGMLSSSATLFSYLFYGLSH